MTRECVDVLMRLDQKVPGVLEGQPGKGGIIGEPVEADVFSGEGHLGMCRFRKKEDDDLEDPDSLLPEEVAKRLLVAIQEVDLGDPGLLLQFTFGGLTRMFARLDVPLGKIPVTLLIMKQKIVRLRRSPEQDHPRGDLTWHIASVSSRCVPRWRSWVDRTARTLHTSPQTPVCAI